MKRWYKDGGFWKGVFLPSIAVIATAFLLGGCGDDWDADEERAKSVEQARTLCAKRGGVGYMNMDDYKLDEVRCRYGAVVEH